MAVDRKTYTRQIGAVGIPNVQFSQYQARAETFQELNKRIDVIKKFALEAGTEEAIEKGKEFGLAIPINLADFLNADPVAREDFLSNGNTAAHKAADAVRINLLTTDLEANVGQKMNSLLKLATDSIGTEFEPTPESLAAMLYGEIDGATELLSMDPEAAMALYASATTKANTSYNAYLDKVAEHQAQNLQSTTVEIGANAIENIVDAVGQDSIPSFATSLVEDFESEDDAILKWEDKLSMQEQAVVNRMKSVGLDDAKIRKFIYDYDAEVGRVAQEKFYVDYIANTNNFDSELTDVENAINITKNFRNRIFLDGQAERLYNASGDKVKLDKDVTAWRTAIVNTFTDEANFLKGVADNKAAKLKADLVATVEAGEFDKVDEKMEVIAQFAEDNPESGNSVYKDALSLIGPFKNAVNSKPDQNFTELKRGLDDGIYGLDDIRSYADDGYITSGRDVEDAGVSDEVFLTNYFNQKRREGVLAAENKLRRDLKLSIIDPSTGVIRSAYENEILKQNGSYEEAQQSLRDAIVKINTYADANPNASKQELLLYADTLLESVDRLTNLNAILKSQASNINQLGRGSTLGLNNSFNRFFREGTNLFPAVPDYDSNWFTYARNNPELFKKNIIHRLETYDLQKNTGFVITGFEPKSDELHELIMKLREYDVALNNFVEASNEK